MTKFMQWLIIVILTGIAAQIVLKATEPLIPYAIIGLVVVAFISRWWKGNQKHW